MKRYKPLFERKYSTIKLDENLRFTDISKNAGLSDFTKHHKKIRNDKMKDDKQGGDVNVTKLVYHEVDFEKDYVLFQFTTPATDIYEKGHKYQATNTENNFDIVPLPGKVYTMDVKIPQFFSWVDTAPEDITTKEIEDVLREADVQVFCDCPSFHWQGMNYIMSTFDASTNPTNIPPTAGNWKDRHHDDSFLCKHLQGLINSFKFYIPQMRQMIKKEAMSIRNV